MSITNHDVATAIALVDFFRNKGLTDYGIAAILGNADKESGLIPTNLQNSGNTKFGITDEEYTRQVDAGERSFIDSQGYGICQWTSSGRKLGLYDMAKSLGLSIGSREVQFNYLYKELTTSSYYKKNVFKYLTDDTASIDTCTRKFMIYYEAPANQSESNQQKRISNARAFYDAYLQGGIPQYRKDIISLAASYIGLTYDSTNNIIFNTEYYGKKLNYKSAYCCVFGWFIYKHAKASKYFKGGAKENRCTDLYDYYKANHPDWVVAPTKANLKKIKPGDLICYNFKNNGKVNHLGIFESTTSSDSRFLALEGNTSSNIIGSQDNGGYVERKTRTLSKVIAFIHMPFPEDVTCPYEEPTKELKKGAKGDGVRWIQWWLCEKGYTVDIDGSFGPATDKAVRSFQTASKIKCDGIVGKVTREYLKSE